MEKVKYELEFSGYSYESDSYEDVVVKFCRNDYKEIIELWKKINTLSIPPKHLWEKEEVSFGSLEGNGITCQHELGGLFPKYCNLYQITIKEISSKLILPIV
jgi:hypothetical protein